jgi:uncharacterized membrane protein YgcG
MAEVVHYKDNVGRSTYKRAIELLEIFRQKLEANRTNPSFVNEARTDLCLLQSRLQTWGASTDIDEPDKKSLDYMDRERNRLHVLNTLMRIVGSLEDRSELVNVYGLILKPNESWGTRFHRYLSRLLRLGPTQQALYCAQGSRANKRITWIIDEPFKFRLLIEHMTFFIERLENLSERIATAANDEQSEAQLEARRRAVEDQEKRTWVWNAGKWRRRWVKRNGKWRRRKLPGDADFDCHNANQASVHDTDIDDDSGSGSSFGSGGGGSVGGGSGASAGS